MTAEERTALLQEMLSCNYKIYLWCYDTSFQLISSTHPADHEWADLMSSLHFTDRIREALGEGSSWPMLLISDFDLVWITAFEYRDTRPHRIYLLGPAFTGRDSRILLRSKLDTYDLDARRYSVILKELENVPIIPSSTLMQYAVMLHCAVTGARITSDQVITRSANDRQEFTRQFDAADQIEQISREHRGVWEAEQRLLSLIREGNPGYLAALQHSTSLSYGVRAEVGDQLRQNKNNLLVLLTLVSRAAIEGGLSSSISYTLNDYYAERIERAENLAQTMQLSKEMLEDYISRIRRCREQNGISPAVRDACDYISIHLTESIPLRDLAARAGYSEYYFSDKFRRETGQSVSEYISCRKLDHALTLLRDTNLSVQEIADRLSYSSRANFATVFRRRFGMTPTMARACAQPPHPVV